MRRLQTRFVFLFLIAIYSQVLLAADLEALPEFLRSDPLVPSSHRTGAALTSPRAFTALSTKSCSPAAEVDTFPFIWL